MSNLKNRLRNGESVIGTMITVFDNPDIVCMLKVCGFDFFIIDSEHGYLDYSRVAGIFGMARALGIPGLIRIPEPRREVVLKYMEAGAAGLLMPNTETPEQAKALVDYSKYAPMGNRGVSLLRAHSGYEKVSSAVEYMKKANEETILMIQIESPKGVANVDKILSVDGIDAAFVEPNDLSQSMGIMGQMDNPEFLAAIQKVIDTAKAKKKFSGIHLMATAPLQKWIEKGMTLNLWGNDVTFLMNAAREGIAQLKK